MSEPVGARVPTPTLGPEHDALYEFLSHAPYGELYSYEALMEIAGVDVRQKRSLILSVGRRLEHEAQRALVCVPKVGYRLALPAEHLKIGGQRHHRGRKQLRAALRVLRGTAHEHLTPEERKRHDAYTMLVTAQLDTLRATTRAWGREPEQLAIDAEVAAKLAQGLARLQQMARAQEG